MFIASYKGVIPAGVVDDEHLVSNSLGLLADLVACLPGSLVRTFYPRIPKREALRVTLRAHYTTVLISTHPPPEEPSKVREPRIILHLQYNRRTFGSPSCTYFRTHATSPLECFLPHRATIFAVAIEGAT